MISLSRPAAFAAVATLVCFISLQPNRCSAELTYFLDFDQPVYNATVDSQVEVTVIFREVATAPDTARLAVGGADGLTQMGFILDYASAVGGPGAALPADGSEAGTVSPLFDDPFFPAGIVVTPSASIAEADGATSDFTNGIEVAPTLPGVFEFEIATFNFDVNGLGESTTLQLVDLDTAFADFIFADDFSPDDVNELIFGSAVINVTAVPEPSSLALLGIAGAGWCVRRRRVAKQKRQL